MGLLLAADAVGRDLAAVWFAAHGPGQAAGFRECGRRVAHAADRAELLQELRARKCAAGRSAVHEHWGPRVLDLDLLVFGREQCTSAELVLPHPGVVARNFVLYPLADIAPDLEVPGHGQVRELLARVGADGIWPL